MNLLDSVASDLDVVVVGTGIAGLFSAITAATSGKKVVVLTKSTEDESNTRYAQGGIAVPIGADDSPSLHLRDTLGCGCGLNEVEVVETLTEEAAECLWQMIDLGVQFDHEGSELARSREAAHSVARVLHSGGDATGFYVQQGLATALQRLGVPVIENAFVTDLITVGGRVVGVQAVSNGPSGMESRRLYAPRVILATGGAGQLYSRTTNPAVATADGVSLAFRAGAEVMDLEFFQFHPTALSLPEKPAFLISEAARGEGGILRDLSGRAFMHEYHADADLAPRDVVSRAIWTEMRKQQSDHVLLDLTHLGAGFIKQRFPTIWATCAEAGLDITKAPAPIAPAAHYFMGGVRTDVNGHTTLPGLFAAGEVACTTVHGANRLASNSLLEGLVFGRRAASADDGTGPGRSASTWPLELLAADFDDYRSAPKNRPELQDSNWRNLGIVRTRQGLADALSPVASSLEHLSGDRRPSLATASSVEVAEMENTNLRVVTELIARAAMLREESRGAHYRKDFPATSEQWRGHIVHSRSGTHFERVDAAVPESVPA